MSINIASICNKSIEDLQLIDSFCKNEFSKIESQLSIDSTGFKSDIEPIDIALPLIYGVVGATIATSESVNDFMAKIHDDASSEKSKTIIGKLLHHKRDDIDQVSINGERLFVDRNGNNVSARIHRLMRGHDAFSFKNGDNPFCVLIKQYGTVRGVVRVFQHLVGDTFSKQGLPIPFHSFFDFYKDGKLSNNLLEFADKCSAGLKKANGENLTKFDAFDQLFTVKASDIATTGLTWVLCTIHNRIRGIEDDVAKCQTKLIGLSSQLFSQSAIGYIKTGLPYISWPTLTALLKQVWTFFRANYSDIKRLEAISNQLVLKNRELEIAIFETGETLQSYDNADDYITELDRDYSSFCRLTNAFEEG